MFPTLLKIGDFRIASYGVCVAAAYLIGIIWLKSESKNMGLSENRFWRLIYCLFFGAIVGGKILFIILNWADFAAGNIRLIQDFRFGFVFYGGFLGAILLGLGYTYFTKTSFLALGDYFGVAIPLGHWLGRLGCLAAGCCYGRPTLSPWGIRFTNPASLVEPRLIGIALHPTQLYEGVGVALIAVFLYRVLRRVQQGEIKKGTVFYGYFLLYSILRFTIEFYRGDDRGAFWLGFSPSQAIALASIIILIPLMRRNGLWTKHSRS